jgi:solute carrier family 25 (mitochondrial iron transporter), member 28/37
MAADASPKFHTSADLLSPDLTMIAQHDGLRFYQYMAAGSVAGVVEHCAMFPIDTLKTRMQAGSPPCRPPLGLRAALFTENPAMLYRGLSAMVLGAGPAHAVYFYVYELSKRLLSVNQNPNNPLIHASSGILATVASDAVFTPMDTIKQRLQLDNSPYKGVMDCVRTVRREEGIGAFFKSYRTTVVMNAPFTAVHFATYEAAKRMLVEVSPESAEEERLVVHATAGAAAGAIAAAVTTPLDVVKTQLQCQVGFLNKFVTVNVCLIFFFYFGIGFLGCIQLYIFLDNSHFDKSSRILRN